MQRMVALGVFGVVAVVATAACSSSEETPSNEASTGQVISALAGDQDPSTNGLPAKYLTPPALAVSNVLRTQLPNFALANIQDLIDNHDTAAGDIHNALGDVGTEFIMRYIASCALPKGNGLTYSDGVRNYGWSGDVGLCPSWYKTPNPNCLDLVSACVIARANARGDRVPVSIRGNEAFPINDFTNHILVQTQTRQTSGKNNANNGLPIKSFGACGTGEGSDSSRNCGWHPLYVGSCKAGETVTVNTTGCTATSPVLLRACYGLHGCDHGEPIEADPEGGVPYRGSLGDSVACSDSKGASVTFQCRLSQSPDPTDKTGFFGIMVAPQDPTVTAAPAVTLTAAYASGGSPTYPESERNIFNYREGAFFGNIFASVSPSATSSWVLYGNMFGCYSEVWNNTTAQLADRFCADPNASSTCFGNKPTHCYKLPNGALASDRVCTTDTAGSGPSFDGCRKATAVTVYVNSPCDFSKDRAACKAECTNQEGVNTCHPLSKQ